MKNYPKRLKRIRWLYENYDIKAFREQIDSGGLDRQFEYIFDEREWLKKLRKLFDNTHEVDSFLDMLGELRQRIIEFYIDYFTHSHYLQCEGLDFTPDLVIGLGCSNSLGLMDKRVNRLGEIARIYPEVKILISGGGGQLQGSEAAIMASHLKKRYSVEEERIFLEEDAMDTIGNALFTKLLLRSLGLLKRCRNIIVVTSPFHAVRAGTLFRNIYGTSHRIVVIGHPYSLSLKRLKKYCDIESREPSLFKSIRTINNAEDIRRELAEQEIRSLYRTNERFMELGRIATDETTVFYELFLYHDVYRHRYDIFRKYHPFIKKINFNL